MSIGLSLLINDSPSPQVQYSHTMLTCYPIQDLFRKILEMDNQLDVTGRFNSFISIVPDGSCEGESCYGDTKEDDYGNTLKKVKASDLLQFSSDTGVIDNWKNAAIWKYLEAIEDRWVILYWH